MIPFASFESKGEEKPLHTGLYTSIDNNHLVTKVSFEIIF